MPQPPPTADVLPDQFEGLIERFDHVSIAVHDIRRASPLVAMLGGRLRAGGISPGGFRWAQWYLAGGGRLEMVAPLDGSAGDHFLVRFLQRHGPGLHHLTFKVFDLNLAIERATELGFEVVGIGTDDPTWKEAFLHPRSANGVLIQLAEWDDQPDPADISLDSILEADS